MLRCAKGLHVFVGRTDARDDTELPPGELCQCGTVLRRTNECRECGAPHDVVIDIPSFKGWDIRWGQEAGTIHHASHDK